MGGVCSCFTPDKSDKSDIIFWKLFPECFFDVWLDHWSILLFPTVESHRKSMAPKLDPQEEINKSHSGSVTPRAHIQFTRHPHTPFSHLSLTLHCNTLHCNIQLCYACDVADFHLYGLWYVKNNSFYLLSMCSIVVCMHAWHNVSHRQHGMDIIPIPQHISHACVCACARRWFWVVYANIKTWLL